MNKGLETLYKSSPIWLQNLMCSVYGAREKYSRFGKGFELQYRELLKSEWWTKEQIERFQQDEISNVVTRAIKNVPYYRSKYSHLLDGGLVTLDHLGVLEKEMLRKNMEQFISDDHNISNLKLYETSGTTGTPLKIYKTKHSVIQQWAVWSRHKSRFGVKYSDRHALFTGKPIVPEEQQSPPFWRNNIPLNQVVFGMRHSNKDNVKSIADRLNKGDFKYYTGYPSIIYDLAKNIFDAGITVTCSPKVIITGAEPLYQNQKLVIQEVFKCGVTDQYGATEGAANASSCPYGNYHEDFEFGYFEIDVDSPDGSGDILMTSFANDAMPLIRYRVGDRGKFLPTNCPCGRNSRILSEVEGRAEDFVLTPEGNKIVRFDYVYKGLTGLKEAQVVQKRLGSIEIRVVKDGSGIFSEANMIEAVRYYISESIKVEIVYYSAIPRTPAGKFRAVLNELSV